MTQHERAGIFERDHFPVSTTVSQAAPAIEASTPTPVRLSDLDRAKGLAILLVVFGHLVARQSPPGVAWYDPLRIAIYLFHMPLFMYLSGYVTFLSGAARVPILGWQGFARRRAARLLVPFALFGLVILCGKLVAANFVTVDNLPDGFLKGLAALVWDTAHSPATSVWYIAVLFVFCLVTPMLLAVDDRGRLLVAVAVLAYVAPLPPILYLDRIGTYFIFFVAGGIAADAGQRWYRLMDVLVWPCLAALLTLSFLVGSGRITFQWNDGAQGFPYKWALLAAGLLSLPAMHGLARHGPWSRSLTLATLGRYVFVIYLLNTPFIGITKAALQTVTPWDGDRFLPFATVLMFAGVLGPIAVKRWLLRHNRALDRLTD